MGTDPIRLRRSPVLHPGGVGDGAMITHADVAATVAGQPVTVAEVDARVVALRDSAADRRAATTRNQRRPAVAPLVTQPLVTERVIAGEAERLGVTVTAATPDEQTVLPDLTARLEIGSVAANILAGPLARARYAAVTAVWMSTMSCRRLPPAQPEPVQRISARRRGTGDRRDKHGGAAWRRAFRIWLDKTLRRAGLAGARLRAPGDPRQPDNTHKH